MKEKILELLRKYDQIMSDPHYSGIEFEQFDDLADELLELFLSSIKNSPKSDLEILKELCEKYDLNYSECIDGHTNIDVMQTGFPEFYNEYSEYLRNKPRP